MSWDMTIRLSDRQANSIQRSLGRYKWMLIRSQAGRWLVAREQVILQEVKQDAD